MFMHCAQGLDPRVHMRLIRGPAGVRVRLRASDRRVYTYKNILFSRECCYCLVSLYAHGLLVCMREQK